MRFNSNYFLAVLFVILLGGCKKWDDHIEPGNKDVTENLYEAISVNSDLTKFKQYVDQTGLDSLLKLSKAYTVWAPSNAALQTLDPAIANDPAKLKNLLLNHISLQSYFVRNGTPDLRVAMLNGKYVSFTGSRFGEASLVSSDKFVGNGVLHVIDKLVPVLPSIWEYIVATSGTYSQNSFITSLNYNAFDPSQAIVDSISASTGLPIYKPGTGLVPRNYFTDRVFNVKREDRLYTYFVMQNNAFVTEADSLKPYFKTASTAATDTLTRWNVVKDLVVEGLLTSVPSSIVSRSGVTVPLSAANVVETVKVSNGIVYVMSKIDVPTASKFGEIVIQGENPSGFLSDKTGNTSYRVRLNPVTNTWFGDIMISGHGVTTYYAYYRLNDIPSVKYRVYALGVNDFQTGAFAQTIVAKSLTLPNTYTTLASLTHNVPLSTTAGAYSELLLGEFTPANFGVLEIQLTSTATNPLVLDYLRLVPVP